MNGITIRPVLPGDVRPAIDLALRVFMRYTAPLLKAESVEYFRASCDDEAMLEKYTSGQWRMFAAFDGARIIGMACECEGCHISKLYVDSAYHRRGIATKLMNKLIAAMDVPRVTLDASPHALPFYTKYGFAPTGEKDPWVPILTPMAYDLPVAIRPALPGDVRPALDFAQRIFEEYVLPGFGPPTIERVGLHGDTEEQIRAYQEGRWAMFVALAGERIVGMAYERDGCHIRKLYVDGAWHRRGIATGLMDAIVQSMGAGRVTLNSSRYALRFYENYGFTPTDTEQNKDGFVFTPMAFDKGA